MDACYKAATELHNEVAATNADFKKVLDAMLAFRNDEYLWWQIAECSYDSLHDPRPRTRLITENEWGPGTMFRGLNFCDASAVRSI